MTSSGWCSRRMPNSDCSFHIWPLVLPASTTAIVTFYSVQVCIGSYRAAWIPASAGDAMFVLLCVCRVRPQIITAEIKPPWMNF